METDVIRDSVFLQFFAPQENPDGTQNGKEELTDIYLDEGLITSLSASSKFFADAGSSVSVTFGNPQGLFNPDKHEVVNSIFGDTMDDYRNLIVPDAKFFIAKGTYADFWDASMTDASRDARLIGIFYADNVEMDLLSQTIAITGEDCMKYLKMSAYVNEEAGESVQRFPLDIKTWPYSIMAVGDIVHYLLEKFGVWHYHPTTQTIAQNSAGTLFTDHGNGFYKTAMSFKRGAEDNDYNILDKKTIYDYIVSLAGYTNYRFFIIDRFYQGLPRPVFYFLPGEPTKAAEVPALGNPQMNVQRLFGTDSLGVNVYSIAAYNPPASTHERPIGVTTLKYTLSDNDVRAAVTVHVGSETGKVKNTGDSYTRMRFRKYRIGYVKDDSIGLDTAWSKGDAKLIASSLMWQTMHSYRKFEASFTNWIKFAGLSYRFLLDYTKNINPLNVIISGDYICDSLTLQWNGVFTTTATFGYLDSVAATQEPLDIGFVDDVNAGTGVAKTSIMFSNVGGSPYSVKYKLNTGTISYISVPMDADNPTGSLTIDTHAGDAIEVQVFGGGQQSDPNYHYVSGTTVGGQGKARMMTR